ncbi:MAG: hypothetical protein ACI8RP_002087, partial [Urechidicola sp.]
FRLFGDRKESSLYCVKQKASKQVEGFRLIIK